MIVAQPSLNLLVGTYTQSGKSEGIYVYTFDPATGASTLRGTTAAENPSFLAVSADGNHVYAANENGNGQGAVSAYAFDRGSGALRLLNQRLTGGDAPCHVTTDHRGSHVILSNYSGGSVSVFTIGQDGSLGPLKQLIQHSGSGPDQSRQQAPHVHSSFFSPDEKRIYVQDLGTDKVHIYDFFPEAANPLVSAAQPFAMGEPGGGPRHLALSADGSILYLVQEMTARVRVFRQQQGRMTPIQDVEMNEPGFAGQNGAADIKLSPDGRFLYASNRGEAHTLAIYRVNAADGTLTKIGNQPVLGKEPRNFTLSPDGRFLLVGNQKSDEVVIFSRDADTGLLTDTGRRITVPEPVCLVFAE